MGKKEKSLLCLLTAIIVMSLASCGHATTEPSSLPQTALTTEAVTSSVPETDEVKEEESVESDTFVSEGTESYQGFLLDNVLHSPDDGEIHYNIYLPDSYDGSTSYALFVTLPGYEGLYFQGVGANLVEAFGFEAQKYNENMIVVAPQLSDWGETSANQAIALTEYILSRYNIDPDKVYLHGMSGGGETGSLVMGKRPELYTAYLATSTRWDGDLEVLAQAQTPVYMAVGQEDSYYGSQPLQEAYAQLHDLYEEKGLTDSEIDEILVLDIRDQDYFTQHGFTDQHAGGQAFAYDEEIMGWLFSK